MVELNITRGNFTIKDFLKEVWLIKLTYPEGYISWHFLVNNNIDRSTPNILDTTNSIIINNQMRLPQPFHFH